MALTAAPIANEVWLSGPATILIRMAAISANNSSLQNLRSTSVIELSPFLDPQVDASRSYRQTASRPNQQFSLLYPRTEEICKLRKLFQSQPFCTDIFFGSDSL